MTKWQQIKVLFLTGTILLCLLISGYAAVEQDEVPAGTAEKCSVYVDEQLEYVGYAIDGVAYVPLRSFCNSLHMGAVVRQSAMGSVMTVDFTAPDGRACVLTARVGDVYLYINDRIVYLGGEIMSRNGNLLVPMDGLCRGFGMTAAAVDGGYALCTADIRVAADGSTVYDAADLKWLSHIINAEAGNQSLEGQICVGNVVLNRVADERFPDSVEAVVFSPNQFCPVKSGSIWCKPDDDAIAAAKLCLEGVNLAGESLYFVNPTTGNTTWFRDKLCFVMSVGDHDFYR